MVAAIGAAMSARVAERAALSEDAATRANFDQHVEQPQSPAAPPPPPPAEPDAPQPGNPGLSERTGEGVNTAIQPADEIAKLNSDGDQVVMSMTGEGKLQLPIPVGDVPLGIGVKGQYGYQITVQQVGDAPAAGENGAPPAYDVTFDKNLLGGGTIEPPIPGIDPAAELNLRTSGSVTMRFATQEDAARAVSILQRLALSESIHDAGSAISPVPDLSNPASNPITDDGSSLPSIPNPLADAIAPSQGDMTFLRDNVISYTSRVGVQERAKVALKFANLGIEPRVDGNQWLTRTVELAHDGQPARLTYTLSGDLDPSTKEKFTVGAQELDQLEIGYVPQNIVDHGQLSGEVSISWDVPADAMDTALSGQPAPELDTLLSGEGLGAPDRISGRLQLEYQTQSPLDLSRTDLQRITFDVATDNPSLHAGPVITDLLNGDVEGAFRGMGDDFSVTATNQTVRRDGVNQQHEIGVEVADVAEAKVSLIAELGLDDITATHTATYTGGDIANRIWGPEEAPPVGEPEPMPEPEPEQFVVVPEDGLNVREAPSTDGTKISAFQNGTFVQATGQTETDAQGRQWVEVRGLDASDHVVQGWVAGDYLAAHPEGAMDETGRINPDLEEQGYEAHTVVPGDTIWDLARRDGADFQDMVQLNQDHLINPGLIFPGDTVYIPGTGHPVPAEPAPEAPAPAQPEPPAPSGPSGGDASSGGTPGPSSGAPSGTAPDQSGSQSGSPGLSGEDAPSQPSAPDTSTQPQPGGAPTNPPSTDGRPDLSRVLHDYQVQDDPGGMVFWEPHGGIVQDLARIFVTDPQEMTASEAALLDTLSPGELNDMQSIRNRAADTAAQYYPAPDARRGDFASDRDFNNWARNDGHQDAFRHAYWNALMTKRFGPEFAQDFATAHEGVTGDTWNPADREAMDLYNNEVGRTIATANPDASDAELAALVHDAIENGDMVVIDSAGELAWSDQVGYGQHGRANDGEAPGTIQVPAPAERDYNNSAS